jgi:membrane-bound lytic murein transglycosylase F
MRKFIPFLLLIYACTSSAPPKQQEEEVTTTIPAFGNLDSIIARGKIIALTDNTATSYFIYKGQPMGYEYELLSLFAQELGVDLEIKIIPDVDDILDSLNAGAGDIAAANLTVTQERKKQVRFTLPHIKTRQMLLQRKPANWRKMTYEQLEKSLVRDVLDLAGKDVYTPLNTSFHQRLVNLESELGDSIFIHSLDGSIDADSVMALIASDSIPFSVADENVARFYRAFHPNVDTKTPISFSQQIAWALPLHAESLSDTINAWMSDKSSKSEYAYIYNKYFKWAKQSNYKAKSDFNLQDGGRISEYDDVIKKYAEKMEWPWPLLASVIYQESHFDPEAVSWTGAKGLMQVMPETAEKYGVDTIGLADPEQNIHAGTSYLNWLYGYWINELANDSIQAIPFSLASYNAGLGHVKDARRLAQKYELNPNIWHGNVEQMILQKSHPKYYTDEVVKHGYCRGSEPFAYVRDIYAMYDHYSNFVK